MKSTTRAAFRMGLMGAMGLVLAAYVSALALHGLGWGPPWKGWYSTVVNNWLGLAADWLPAAVCWLAVSRVGFRRPEVLLAAAGVTSFALADTYYTAIETMNGSVPFPSLGDVGFLGLNVLMMAALVAAVRRHVRGVRSPVWLDGAVGSLGAAAVLAVVLRPVLDAATAGPHSLATPVAVAYPLLDLMLVAIIVGIGALGDVRVGGRWALLIVGLLAYAATDVVYALQATKGTYAVGTLLDAGWAIGLALIAMWVDGAGQPEQPARKEPRPVSRARALAVSTVATVAGLGVLVMSSRVPVSTLAVALAGVTLLAAAARSQLAFRLLERMAHLRRLDAATDELTGLPNRRALYAEGLVRLTEPQHRRQALLMLDLDKFKDVNDNLGHHVGDQLLVQVAVRLREHVRGGDLLARLGGDEFALLLDDTGRDKALDVAVKLRAALDEAFTIEGLALHSRVSIGIALFPEEGPDLSTLLHKADIAMYKAKTSLEGHHVYCVADDADDSTRRHTVEELRTALNNDQLVVHYQPKIDLDTGEVHGVEALVRWEHPTRGLLHPDAFLALAEGSGLMPTLTRVVLSLAMDQVATWQARGQQLTVSVNLSASSLFDADLPKQVAAMLAARRIPPHALQLEITEEFLMADRDRARNILTRLRDSNVQISVDHFGTSYSSLSYLRDMPIDELKLDRSFVLPVAEEDRTAVIVASAIDLAHSLGLRIVAEGVETKAAFTELTRLGCDQAQGYFLSHPVPAAELDQWLNNRRALDQSTLLPQPLPTVAG